MGYNCMTPSFAKLLDKGATSVDRFDLNNVEATTDYI